MTDDAALRKQQFATVLGARPGPGGPSLQSVLAAARALVPVTIRVPAAPKETAVTS